MYQIEPGRIMLIVTLELCPRRESEITGLRTDSKCHTEKTLEERKGCELCKRDTRKMLGKAMAYTRKESVVSGDDAIKLGYHRECKKGQGRADTEI